MRKSTSTTALIATALLCAFATLTPLSAAAREGAQSVGQGVKCYTTVINGVPTRVCYKGV